METRDTVHPRCLTRIATSCAQRTARDNSNVEQRRKTDKADKNVRWTMLNESQWRHRDSRVLKKIQQYLPRGGKGENVDKIRKIHGSKSQVTEWKKRVGTESTEKWKWIKRLGKNFSKP